MSLISEAFEARENAYPTYVQLRAEVLETIRESNYPRGTLFLMVNKARERMVQEHNARLSRLGAMYLEILNLEKE